MAASDSENMVPVQKVVAFNGQPTRDDQDKLGIGKKSELCLRKTELGFADHKYQGRFKGKLVSGRKTQTTLKFLSQITLPCVSYGSDEGHGDKLKIAQQSEGNELGEKSAVENDDVSSVSQDDVSLVSQDDVSLLSQFEIDPFDGKLQLLQVDKVSSKTFDRKSRGENPNVAFVFCNFSRFTC